MVQPDTASYQRQMQTLDVRTERGGGGLKGTKYPNTKRRNRRTVLQIFVFISTPKRLLKHLSSDCFDDLKLYIYCRLFTEETTQRGQFSAKQFSADRLTILWRRKDDRVKRCINCQLNWSCILAAVLRRLSHIACSSLHFPTRRVYATSNIL